MRDKYLRLMQAYSSDEEDLETIRDAVDALVEYVKTVYIMELHKEYYRMTTEGEEYRAEIKRLDDARHHAHEAAITATKMLNRMAEMAEVPVLFEGDLGQRQEVAEFCMAFVDEVFATRVCVR